MDGQTGVDAQQTLEDMGLTVEIQKEYSELNDDGTPVTDPGYAVSTTPAAGNSVSAGDSVTLLVSRGVDYGDSVEVPSVVGMTKNDAVTTFGKFLNVEVKEEKSTEVAEGEVISQEPEAGNWEDPDNVNVVITVSTGDQEPSAQSDSADTAASSDVSGPTRSIGSVNFGSLPTTCARTFGPILAPHPAALASCVRRTSFFFISFPISQFTPIDLHIQNLLVTVQYFSYCKRSEQ